MQSISIELIVFLKVNNLFIILNKNYYFKLLIFFFYSFNYIFNFFLFLIYSKSIY